MSYCTVEDIKAQKDIAGGGDDPLLWSFIADIEKRINRISHYVSFAPTQDSTRYVDCDDKHIDGALLIPDFPLCSITSITNGDATTVASGSYVLEPRDGGSEKPIWGIRLKDSSGLCWTYTTDWENAITIVGKVGYSTSVPDEVKALTVEAVIAKYAARENPIGETIVIDGRSFSMPKDIDRFLENRLRDLGLIRL